MNLTTIDWIIMLVYFVFVLGIGVVLKRYHEDQHGFLSWRGARFPRGFAGWLLFPQIWARRK